MKKRLLSIMLSVVMVLTIVPMTGSLAFAADVLITEATATMSLPVVGDDGSGITVSAPADANYTAEFGGAYLREDPFPEVNSTNPFQAGKEYGIYVRFKAKPGYYLTNYDTEYIINGEVNTIAGGDLLRRVYYTIPGVKTYNLTTQVNYGHGSISESKPNLPENSAETVTFTPDDGYVLDEVTVNGSKAYPSGNQLQVTMNAGKFVVATYRKIGTYHITTNVNGGHGRISAGERNLEANTTKTITFTPNSGYRVGKVLVNGEEVSVSNNSISVTVVDKDINIVVNYTKNVITEATATMSEPEAGEDGSRITVSAPADANYTVEYAGAFLAEDPYPAVSAENPFQAGKNYGIKVRFIPKGDYTFDSTANYTINGNSTASVGDSGRLRRVWYATPPAEELLSSNVTISSTSHEYDGDAKTPSVTVKDASDTVLVEGKDYEVSYADNINVGTATATVTGKNKYFGTISKTFTITPQAINTSNVALSSDSYIYDGKIKKPTVTVKNAAGINLKEDKDYTVSYDSGRKYVGEYAVTITGKGNYDGCSVTKIFTINPKKASLTKLTAGSSSIKAYWSKISSQATGYELAWKAEGDADFTVEKITKYSTTSKTISGLPTAKAYTAKIRTYKTVGGETYYSDWSAEKSTVILPEKPEFTAANGIVPEITGFTANWKVPDDGDRISGYELKYSTYSSMKKAATIELSSADSSFTAEGLINGKTYYVQLRSFATINGDKKYSSWSAKKSVKTSLQGAAFAKESALIPDVKSVVVNFDAAYDESKIDGYEIRYSTSSSLKNAKTEPVAKDGRESYSKEITDLANGKTYYFQIRTHKTIGDKTYYSSWCTKKSMKTFPQGAAFAADNPLVVDVPIMKVTWKPVAIESKIDGYEVRYSTSSSLKNAKTIGVTAGTYSVDVPEMVYGKTYYFQVRTYKALDDKMYYSSWCTKKSKAYKLSTVSFKSSGALVGSVGTFTANWNAPADVDNIDGYEVRYSTSSTMKSTKTKEVTGADTLTCNVEDLAKRSYYVQVRSYADADGERYYSSWNTKKKVSVK